MFLIYIQLFCCYGVIQVAAGSSQTHPDQERNWQSYLCCLTYVRYLLTHSGWRIYMEDAHISQSPITNSKHSLFGVFDGHGGTPHKSQELRLQLSWSVTL